MVRALHSPFLPLQSVPFQNIIDRCALTIYSKNFLLFLVLLYWMYKILSSLFILQQLSRQEASSVVTVPAIVIVAAYVGLFLDAYVLLVPLIVAMVYEVVVSAVKMTMVLLFTYKPSLSFDPSQASIALLQSVFKDYAVEMRKDPILSFAREACVTFFCFLTFLVTVFQISEIARKERERQERNLDQLLHQHRHILVAADFPSDDEEGMSTRIALSPPTYSMAIRNEGVRRFAPELCITEDTAPPSYSALRGQLRINRSPSASLARTPSSAGALPSALSTPHSAGLLAPPTYSTPDVARLEPPPPMSACRIQSSRE